MMLNTIEMAKPNLRKSERKVADFVLAQPSEVMNMSIAALATDAKVSEPTVIRFCRAIGCKGFQHFKLQLAQSLATGVRYFHRNVSPNDATDNVAVKVFDHAIGALVGVRNSLNPELMQRAIDILAHASKIEFYGFGASGIVAVDAHHKFLRLGVPTTACTDPYTQRITAALLKPDHVAVVISTSGRNPALLQSVDLALAAGASIVGITASASPLAKKCSVALFADVLDTDDVYRTMTSRLAHLVILDALEVGIAMQRGPEFLDRLEQIKRNEMKFHNKQR